VNFASGIRANRAAVLLFVGLFGIYLAFSPGTVDGRGYIQEDMDSGLHMLKVITGWTHGRSAPPMVWSQHGAVSIFFDLPFIEVGTLLATPDAVESIQFVLFTAALITLLYLWLLKICTPGMSLLLTLSAAFGTMLWPYAYIGLETKQSFFVLLTGYLALACGRIRTWPGLVLFATCCGLSLTLKSTGLSLLPAVAYVAAVQFKDDWRERRTQVYVLIAVALGVWAVGAWTRNIYWNLYGGSFQSMRPWMIDSVMAPISNLVGVFGSPVKGLFVYAPIVIISLFAIPVALKRNPSIPIFAILVTAGTAAVLSLMKFQYDEVWGCRYMHLAIAPLILCIGAACPRFYWRRDFVLIATVLVGFVIAFLGAFFYYGVRSFAARDAQQNTAEWLTGDIVWNELTFSSRLFNVWLWKDANASWTPGHIWAWVPPPGATPWQTVDLRKYAEPQSYLLKNWSHRSGLKRKMILGVYGASLVIGLLALVGVFAETRRADP